MGPDSAEMSFDEPDFMLARASFFVSILPSGVIRTQSSARIALILLASPAIAAAAQSCSNCLRVCDTLEADVACGRAEANPAQVQTNKAATANFFTLFLLRSFVSL